MGLTYSRLVTSFSLGLIMLVVAMAPIGLPPPANVDAGHDGPTTSHLLETERYKTTGGRIVRNVILGNAIPVCSDDLPLSTKAAVDHWNAFFGEDVFELEVEEDAHGRKTKTVFESADAKCKAERLHPSLGIGSVLVEQDLKGCEGVATGCIDLDASEEPNTAWDTYAGQPRIYVEDYPIHLVTDRHVLADGHARVTRTVTHELGHVFGLDDYPPDFCTDPPAGTADRLDYTTRPTIMGPAQRADGTTMTCHSVTPTVKDRIDFALSYVPEAPDILDGQSRSPARHTVIVAWDAYDVHVETEFEVQRKNTDGEWERVGAHAARPFPASGGTVDEVTVSLFGQPPGSQTYRVASKSEAPFQPLTPRASGEVTVAVKGSIFGPPTGLTAAAGDRSISLTWDASDDDPPLDRYQYRLNGGQWQDMTGTDGSSTSYTLSPLVNGTEYLVEIQAVRGTRESGPSNAVRATPQPADSSPVIGRFWRVTGGQLSATFTWVGSAPYSVWWELQRASTENGSYSSVADAAHSDSTSPVTFSDQSRGWYKVRGRACVPGAFDSPPTCGVWSASAGPVHIPATPPPRPGIVEPPTEPDPDPEPEPEPPPKPPDTFQNWEVVLSTWVVWEEEGDGLTFCYEQQYRYTRYEGWHSFTTHFWNDSSSSWVPGTVVFTSGVHERKSGTGGVRIITCTGSSADAGAQGTSGDPAQYLVAGDYGFTWGGTSISFTLPADALIDLTWRVLDSGVRAAVLTDAGAGEVLVYPGAPAARDARSSDGSTHERSATLQSIETSMVEAQSATATATTPESSTCTVVSSDGSSAAIDLDAGRCASVPSGGAVRFAVGDNVLSLTLTADRFWLVARLDADGSEQVALLDVTSSSVLLLDADTGAELQRIIPDDAETRIGPIFDAIVTSATSS